MINAVCDISGMPYQLHTAYKLEEEYDVGLSEAFILAHSTMPRQKS
jgi:hypothetical protein